MLDRAAARGDGCASWAIELFKRNFDPMFDDQLFKHEFFAVLTIDCVD